MTPPWRSTLPRPTSTRCHWRRGVCDAAEASGKPVAASFLPARIVTDAVAYLQERGIPNFATGERAWRAELGRPPSCAAASLRPLLDRCAHRGRCPVRDKCSSTRLWLGWGRMGFRWLTFALLPRPGDYPCLSSDRLSGGDKGRLTGYLAQVG